MKKWTRSKAPVQPGEMIVGGDVPAGIKSNFRKKLCEPIEKEILMEMAELAKVKAHFKTESR